MRIEIKTLKPRSARHDEWGKAPYNGGFYRRLAHKTARRIVKANIRKTLAE